MKRWVAAKIHGITVTDKSVDYHGSVSICPQLMEEAGIEPYESVDVINLNSGARWTTYALQAADLGQFTLNGGGARLGELGDRCVVLTYRLEDWFRGAWAVHVDTDNEIVERLEYEQDRTLG